MLNSSPDGLEWRRSSRCNSGACVEVAWSDDTILVRESGNPGGDVLSIGARVWQEFISAIRDGRFGTE